MQNPDDPEPQAINPSAMAWPTFSYMKFQTIFSKAFKQLLDTLFCER